MAPRQDPIATESPDKMVFARARTSTDHKRSVSEASLETATDRQSTERFMLDT